jgi:hypothetical protein
MVSRAIKRLQVPFANTFDTIWEYKKSFLAHLIDFISFIGPFCPICGKEGCYRQITHYWRYAIDLFPEFEKDKVPIARFLCKESGKTFSLLPTQLIPYHQYTVHSVTGALLLGLKSYELGRRGFYDAARQVAPDSGVTPWLVSYWLAVVLGWFRHAHAALGQWYDLSCMSSFGRCREWEDLTVYFRCLGWDVKVENLLWALLEPPVNRYSRETKLFLFGTPSQWRNREGPA